MKVKNGINGRERDMLSGSQRDLKQKKKKKKKKKMGTKKTRIREKGKKRKIDRNSFNRIIFPPFLSLLFLSYLSTPHLF